MADWVLIGADGMLGRCWEELLVAREIDHVATTIEDLDITDAGAVARVVKPGVSWVVNCAAYTLVDAAEEHEALANQVNGYAVGRVAGLCKSVGAKLLHYRIDYVFDGNATEPYRPDHPRNRDTLRVVDDQRGRPTDSRKLAEVSLALLQGGHRGTFHVTDGGECTWFELASLVASIVNPNCNVEPCTSEEFPRPAPRPAYSGLDLSGMERLVGPLVPWEERVRDVLAAVGVP